ncbi:GNAT family N-acetyltransferase [Jonesiaceae bacterium BS-20]|uniref:GNAT family N-acetyltransferase n=1 Tax=Jonesiaceae bacterium BS-20 TaxID=3120821 RepID=A0AAU7DWG3_9MICO
MTENNEEEVEIVQNAGASRFEAQLPDGTVVGYLQYELQGTGLFNKTLAIPSTVVQPAYEGRGIAGRLASESFSWARKLGATVNPICPFIKAYIDRNPVYQDLLG